MKKQVVRQHKAIKKLESLTGYVHYTGLFLAFAAFIVIGILLFLMSEHNYLLFHTTAELFSIIIAAAIFILAWNTRNYSENANLLFLGTIYLFVGILDFFHTLTYKGINLFDTGVFHATEFWVAARYMESISLFVFMLFFNRFRRRFFSLIVIAYTLITTSLVLSILVWKIFPVCYIDLPGKGLTPFKIISEYLIMAVLAVSLVVLILRRKQFKERLLFYMVLCIITTIISEFFFTLYTDVYGMWNYLGHFFKIISFYLVYKSIIQFGLRNPFEVIFNELKQNEIKLEQANTTKNKFFSIIAHDLKGPFSGILGFSKLLAEKYDDISEENRKYFVGLIHSSSEQAFNLLENLLHWARVQSNKLQVNKVKVNLASLLKDIFILFENYAKKKDIGLEADVPDNITIRADKSMIFTVISNLVNNGIKYTKPGGSITVSAEISEKTLRVKVADTGVGIDKENLDKLFRIDTSYSKPGTEHENGTGLGLVLCKEFVEMHHGKIRAESTVGKGSVFSFSIPV
jgi:signal transduction histidine kinase